MIIVKAILEAQPGKEDELEILLRAIVPKVLAEEGTIGYTLHRALNTPRRFFFYEKYRDQEAFDYHMATYYLQELIKRFDGLLVHAPDLELFEEIAGFNRIKG
jgi:quinol monooxygenase YgiN